MLLTDTALVLPAEDPDRLTGEAKYLAWDRHLGKRLDIRAEGVFAHKAFYNGFHPVEFATAKWKETFGEQFGELTDNWSKKTIKTKTDRMLIEGFDAPQDAEIEAMRAIWRRGQMKIGSRVAHTNMLVSAYSPVSVWMDRNKKALVRVEDPANTIVQRDPETGVDRLAALKRWKALDGTVRSTLYLPNEIVQMQGTGDGLATRVLSVTPNRLGVVPVLEAVNDPDEHYNGVSDLDSIMSLNLAVKKLLSDMMVASEFAAYMQRVLIGVEVPINPETGEPDQSLVGGINRWLAIEDPDAKVQELSAADLSNYTKPIDLLVQHIAALSDTPPHYLLAAMVNVSGDALAAAESSLVSRARGCIDLADPVWAEAMSLGLEIEGYGAGIVVEPVWTDPERVSISQLSDALQKQKDIGVPRRALYNKLASPPEAKKWEEWANEDDERMAEIEARAAGISGPSGLPAE